MTIPVSSVVGVNITVGAQFPTREGFGTLAVITAETNAIVNASNRIKLYANIDEVAGDWATSDEAYKVANSYFSQNPRPTKLKIAWRDDANETITQALNAIENADSDWYGFVFTKEIRDLATDALGEGVEKASDWAEARTKVFFTVANSVDVLDSGIATDIASVLKAKTLRRTSVIYSSTSFEYADASALGRAFTTDFSQVDSTITLKFKQLPGITVENLGSDGFANLSTKFANAYISVGGRSMYAESYMSNGSFFDELHGLDWLTSAIKNNIFGYMLTRPTKVPFTDKGTASLEQQLIKALDEAKRNGLIGAGTTIDGEFLPNGYKTSVVKVADVPQAQKDARQYNGLSFVVIGAGAIHSVQVNGIFER